jgi:hypothetical protein
LLGSTPSFTRNAIARACSAIERSARASVGDSFGSYGRPAIRAAASTIERSSSVSYTDFPRCTTHASRSSPAPVSMFCAGSGLRFPASSW